MASDDRTILVGVGELARCLDKTPRRVQQLVAEGALPRAIRGKYDLIPCLIARIRSLEGELNEKRAPMQGANERLRAAKAKRQEIENDELEGARLPRESVLAEWQDIAHHVKVSIRAVPREATLRIPGVTRKMGRQLAVLLDEALRGLAGFRGERSEKAT